MGKATQKTRSAVLGAFAVILGLSGWALAMDCGLYYAWGTEPYARCEQGNAEVEAARHERAMNGLRAWQADIAQDDASRKTANEADYDSQRILDQLRDLQRQLDNK